MSVRRHYSPHSGRRIAAVIVLALVTAIAAPPVAGAATMDSTSRHQQQVAAAGDCSPGQSGAAVPTQSSGRAAVRTTIGVAKTMGVSTKGQIVAVMVMFQESSIRNLANDGSSTQNASWSSPGKAYWMSVTRLSLKYPHDKFGNADAAHDTDSVGLYQQRPSSGWGNYGQSTGTTDPEGVIQRLLDPRWEAMAFFGGNDSAAPTSGLLDIAGWESMAPTYAANAVQRSNYPEYYAKWEAPATTYVNENQDAPAIALPWFPGGGGGALACTSIPTDPAAGEAGRNPLGSLDAAVVVGNHLQVDGWAFDPDAANGLTQIHFYDQGPFGTLGYPIGVATLTRDDVNRAYNVLGKYGFSADIPWNGPGQHTICAHAINVGRGTGNSLIGCRAVTVPGPLGSLDGAKKNPSSNQIDVIGWAADPGSPGAREEVHIYVTGPNGTRGIPGILTGDSRPDVSRAFAWAGGNRGFHATVPGAGPGDNQVCAYAINVKPPRNNPQIGCRTVTMPPDPPFGSVDAVAVAGSNATVAGWALDRQSSGTSIAVHIYVTNGVSTRSSAFTADGARPDVNSAFGVGGRHGFSGTVPLYPGANQVCAYSIGVTAGNNALISCRGVTRSQVSSLAAAEESTAPAATEAAPTSAPSSCAPTNGHADRHPRPCPPRRPNRRSTPATGQSGTAGSTSQEPAASSRPDQRHGRIVQFQRSRHRSVISSPHTEGINDTEWAGDRQRNR